MNFSSCFIFGLRRLNSCQCNNTFRYILKTILFSTLYLVAGLFGNLRTIVCLPFSFVYSVYFFFLLPGRVFPCQPCPVSCGHSFPFGGCRGVPSLDWGLGRPLLTPKEGGSAASLEAQLHKSLTFLSGYNPAKFISLSLLVACPLWGMGFESLLSSRNHVLPGV